MSFVMPSRRAFLKSSSAAMLLSGMIDTRTLRGTTIDRSAEALALIQFVEQTHPRGIEARSDSSWQSLSDSYVRASAELGFEGFVIETARLLRWFRDGHTTLSIRGLEENGFGPRLPFQSAAFFDGLFIYRAGTDALPLLGTRISRVGKLSVEEIARRFIDIWPANNVANAHNDLRSAVELPGFLLGLGAIDDRYAPIAVEGVDSVGRTRRVDFKMTRNDRADLTTIERSLTLREQWAEEAGTGNYVREEGETLYISLDTLNVPRDQFEPFLREAIAAIERTQSGKLIIDLRRNYGGNNYFGEPLRKTIARSKLNRSGGLYVLISPTTFSAAQNLATRLERETFAIFVGEPTGGSPNHYGDSARFPDSIKSLSGGVSTLPWFDSYPRDTRQWIMPDLLLPRTFEEWSSGSDVAFDAARSHVAVEPINPLDPDHVLYFARASQSQTWNPFWRRTE